MPTNSWVQQVVVRLPDTQRLRESPQGAAGQDRADRVHAQVETEPGGGEARVLGADHSLFGTVQEVPQHHGSFIDPLVTGEQDATGPRAHRFLGLQTERGCVAEGPHVCPGAHRAVRLRAVLDNSEPMLPRERGHCWHVGGHAVEVGDNDGSGPGGQMPLQVGRVEVPGPLVDVDEYGHGVHGEQRHHGGEEGIGGREHLVARLQTDPEERRIQRGRTGIDGKRMAHPDQQPELLLQLVHLALVTDVGDLAPAEHRRDKGEVLLGRWLRSRLGQPVRRGCTTEQRQCGGVQGHHGILSCARGLAPSGADGSEQGAAGAASAVPTGAGVAGGAPRS